MNRETKFFETEDRVIAISDSFRNAKYEQRDYKKAIPNPKAALAIELVARWGAVAAKTDGEDTTGRAKLELQNPTELVERACSLADLIYDEVASRGWMMKCPDPRDFMDDGDQD